MSDKGGSRSRSKSPLSRSPSPGRSGQYSRGQYDRSRSRSGSRHRSSRRRSRSRSRSPYRSRRRSSRHRSPKEQRREEPKPSARSRSPYNSRYDDGYRGGYDRDRDRDRGYDRGPRYRSRSPMSRRRRHQGSREDPKESRCLGVFGLSMYTQERELRDLFSRYGPIDDCQVVYDHQTGRSRGFAFLYMRNVDDAIEAKEMVAGTELDGHKIRVDFSITKRAHTPTPGIYLGRSTRGSGYRGGDRGGGGSGYHRRSPSPYYGGRRGGPGGYSRSRSRSYSPRPRY